MYARRQSLSEFRQDNQELDNLRLQTFVLQQKNLTNKEEIARAQSETRKVQQELEAERIKAQKIKGPERSARAALQEKEAQAATLAAQVKAEQKRVQEALSMERSAKAALQEKNAQMDRLMAQVNSLTGQLSDVQTRAGKLQMEQEGIRNELRSVNARTVTAPTPQTQPAPEQAQAPNRFVVLSPDMVEHNSTYRHVPYIFEVTPATRTSIVKDTVYYHYIEDDESRGLGSPGRTGYIKNDGAGDITYRLFDKQQDTWSYPAIIRAGEAEVFDYGDNIRVNTVEIIPDSNRTMYRLRFSPGIEQVFSEAEVKVKT